MALPIDTTAPDAGPADKLIDPFSDSLFKEPGLTDQPGPARQLSRQNRLRAEDLSARGIPAYRTKSGDVSEVTDDTGGPLSGLDKRHNIAYDSQGQPKQISYDESGPPIVSDPFAKLPKSVDEKTGAIEQYGPGGIYKYLGQDPAATAKITQATQDKSIKDQTALLGRKLTLDEHDLAQTEKQKKDLRTDLSNKVPTLLDPKFEGADPDTVHKAIDEHFDTQYAAPEANAKSGFFGTGEYTPEAAARRAEIDKNKQQAHDTADTIFGLNEQGTKLHDVVSQQRIQERAGIEQELARSRGQAGPLDQPGLKEPGNIDLNNRPVVQNSDGTVSTELSFSRGTDKGEVLVPRVVDGQVLSEKDAWDHYKQTGEHLGVFDSPQAADAYATKLHNQRAQENVDQGLTTVKGQLYPPPETWERILGGKDAVAAIQDHVREGNIPAPIAPAASAAAHDVQDANEKADALKDSDPTTAEKYKDFAARILNGASQGLGEILRSPAGQGLQPGGWANPLNWGQELTNGLEKHFFGESLATKAGKALPEATQKLVDQRLDGTLASKAANFIGGIAPYVGMAIATKGTSVATPLMATMFYSSGYQRTIEDAQKNGKDPNDPKIQAAATGIGAINAVLALPLRTVGAAAEAVFGDTAPKVIQRAITNAFEQGGAEQVGGLLGRLAEAIKSGGAGSEKLRQEAVEGIQNVMAEIQKPAAQRIADVGKIALQHAALGAGVQTAENLTRKTYNPNQGTFEGVPETAIGFGALGAVSEGFRQVALARKAKQALDIINQGKVGPAEPAARGPAPGLPGGPKGPPPVRETSPTPVAPPGESAKPVSETSPKAAPLAEPAQMSPAEIANELKGIGYTVSRGEGGKVELARGEQENVTPKEARAVALHEELQNRETAPTTVEEEAHKAATSPKNALAEPSDAQKEAGNYQKGHVTVGGLDISIENPAGTQRKPEFAPLESHYGYIKGTVGADKDHVDIFVKPETPTDWNGAVYVVNQHDQAGNFDEHKAVLGVNSPADAKAEYNKNYPKGWTGGQSVIQFENPQEFKKWAESGSKGPATDPRLPADIGKLAASEGLTFNGTSESGHLMFSDTKSGKPTTFSIPKPDIAVLSAKLRAVRARMEGTPEQKKAAEELAAKKKTETVVAAPPKESALFKRNKDLAERLNAVRRNSTPIEERVIKTLLRSGTGKALDQAERKLEKIEERAQPRPGEQKVPSPPKPAEKPSAPAPSGEAIERGPTRAEGLRGRLPAELASSVNSVADAKQVVARALKVFSKQFEDRGITPVEELIGRGGLAIRFRKGQLSLLLDYRAIAANAAVIQEKGGSGGLWTAYGLIEEKIHHDDLTVSGPGQFLALHLKFWRSLSKDAQDAVRQTYRSTNEPAKLGIEYVRMVAQFRELGNITEANGRNVDAILPFLDREQTPELEAHLKKMGALVEGGQYAIKTGQQPSGEEAKLPGVRGGLDLPAHPEKVREEESGQTKGGSGPVQRPETSEPEQKPATRQPDVPQIDEQAKKALDDAFEGIFAETPTRELGIKLPANVQYEGQGLGWHYFTELDKKSPSYGGTFSIEAGKLSDKALAEAREAQKSRFAAGPSMDVDLFLADQPIATQKPMPAEKLPQLIKAAQEMIRQNVDTPEKLAKVLEAQFSGKARPYSQAFWDAIGIVRPDLRGTPNWEQIYAPGPKGPEAGFSDIIRARLAQGDRIDRRALTALAKEHELDTKYADELAEFAIISVARGIAQEMGPVGETFDKMVDLYDRQPNLTAKTSTSKVAQAYSTPVPLAFLSSILGDAQIGSVYEPTAGNGALLLRTDPKIQNVYPNEMDAFRAIGLKRQGFTPTTFNALNYVPSEKVDRVIANPPFGTVLDEEGVPKRFPMWPGQDTTKIDYAIAAKSLSAMKDNGRAVLILGGKKIDDPDERANAYAEATPGFWKGLYEKYGVIDHFTVAGDLYSKQGAGWPVDVILIQGRGKSPIPLPSAEAPRIIASWDELRKELSRTDQERVQALRITPEKLGQKVSGVVGEIRDVVGPERGAGEEEHPQQPGRPESGTRPIREPATRPGEGLQPSPGRSEQLPGTPATSEGREPVSRSVVEAVERGQLGYRVPYTPASKEKSFGIFVPTNMEAPMREALAKLEARVGPIDEFVKSNISFKPGSLSAEQIDGLGLMLNGIQQGVAAVNGDQGGVGKGRVMAALMGYAKDKGQPAIFVTKDDKLWAAMIEDLHDIGRDDVVPLITKNNLNIEDYSGKKWIQGNMTAVMQEIARNAALPEGTHVLFTSYAQIQTDEPPEFKASKAERAAMHARHMPPPDGARMEALKALAPQAILIMDESHLASGDSIRAWRLHPLLEMSNGSGYSSATFAKRPDSMGIYSQTTLSHATGSMSDLVDAMRQGGVPLQQVVSSILAGDGLYFRRERDFSHAVFRTHINTDTGERDKKLADNYTDGLRTILSISTKMQKAVKALNKLLRNRAKMMRISNVPRIESANFAIKLHNLIGQYLYAIKAQSIVQRTVEGVQKGFTNKEGKTVPHKIVIAVQNTMEAPITALQRGGRPLSFNGLLLSYLDEMREIKSGSGANAQVTTITDTPDDEFEGMSDRELQNIIVRPTEDPENPEVNEKALAELFRRLMSSIFKDAEAKIGTLDLADMPVSPIDYIRQQLNKVGIKNAEITGRSLGLDEDGAIYKISPEQHSKAAHLRYLKEFNNGDTQALIMNASGSTGISAHASEKFKSQEPRAMIIGQPNHDINEFIQTLYRIDRTGQVAQPYYELLQTTLPAELRPAAVLSKKMASLNANTTSNAQNEISVGNRSVDIFNQYGDEAVYNYLKSDPTFTDLLDMPKIMQGDTNKILPIADVLSQYPENGTFARAVTGRAAVLPTEEQEIFWEKVVSDYTAKLTYLTEIGENELLVDTMNLKAQTLESKELTPRVTGKTPASGFDEPSNLEKIKAEIGTKPLPGSEVVEMMEKLNAQKIEDDWRAKANTWKEKELARLKEKVLTWNEEKEQHYLARWRDQEEEIIQSIHLIGGGLHLKTDKGMDGYGAVTEVKFDDEHPITPSKQIFTLHVNTTKNHIRVPASQLFAIARVAYGDFDKLYESTAERSNERYMVTGNLLAAYLAIRDSAPTAKIVQYTTDTGELKQGILMPAKFKTADLAKKTMVSGPNHARQLLDAGRTLQNGDGSVTMAKPRDRYIVRVPSSKIMGGAYWRDSALAKLMDNSQFEQRGSAMIGYFQPNNLAAIYQRLKELGADLYYIEQQAGETFGADEGLTVHAASFYKDDVEPIAKSIGLGAKESLDLLTHLLSPTSGVQMEARDQAMKMLGTRYQKMYETDRVLEAWNRAMDKLPRPEQIAFIDKMKQGQVQSTPQLQDLAKAMRKIDTESWDAARAAYKDLGFKDNEIPLAWLENHYRVLWKKIPGGPDKGEWIGKARRGLRGSMGQHKQHTLDTMSEGLAEGGVPYSYNPVFMFKLAQADLWKLTTTLRAWKWAKDTGNVAFVRGPFPKAPDGMVPLNDTIAKVYFPAESGEGLINAGQYFVEEGFGRLLNNYLSTDHVRAVALGRGLLWLKNFTTSLELSLSPFHAVFETLDAVGSNIGLGLTKLVNRGVLGGSAKVAVEGLRDIIGALGTPVTHGIGPSSLGQQIRKAAGNPEEFFKSADGKKMLKSYPRAREMIDDLFQGGWKPTELEQDWRTNSVRSFLDAKNDKNYIGATVRALPALNEMLMKPLFDYYIPNLKVAQFFKEYAEAMEANERKLKGGILTRAALARQVWRSVENRFGELNYDTLFWNRTFKSAMQLMFRSVTWKLGTVSQFGGAFGEQGKEFKDAFKENRAPQLNPKMGWLFGMFVLTAVLGTVISVALGHRNPKNLTDVVFPQVDPKDNKVRVSLPTYFKDLVHLIHSPLTYVTSSMSGWIGRVADLLRNKDYYGVQIHDNDDPITKQALDIGKYAAQSLLPFSIRGYKNLSASNVDSLRKSLALVGVMPAPRFIGQTAAEQKAEAYWKDQRAEGGERLGQYERSLEKRQIVSRIEHGKDAGISAALSKGTIKPRDVKTIYQRASMGALPSQVLHMPLEEAEKIYQRANASEKASLTPIMARKRANAAKAGRSAFSGF